MCHRVVWFNSILFLSLNFTLWFITMYLWPVNMKFHVDSLARHTRLAPFATLKSRLKVSKQLLKYNHLVDQSPRNSVLFFSAAHLSIPFDCQTLETLKTFVFGQAPCAFVLFFHQSQTLLEARTRMEGCFVTGGHTKDNVGVIGVALTWIERNLLIAPRSSVFSHRLNQHLTFAIA